MVITILEVFLIVLLVRAVLSWFPIGYSSPLRPTADLLFRVTEPVLAPLRRALPSMGGLDLSVLVAMLVIQFVLIPVVNQVL